MGALAADSIFPRAPQLGQEAASVVLWDDN